RQPAPRQTYQNLFLLAGEGSHSLASAAVSPRHFPFAPFDRLTPRRPCVATPHPCLVCLKDMNITQRQWQAGQRCLPRRPRHRAPRLRPTMAKDKDIEAGDAPSYVTRHTQVSLRWHAWGSHEVCGLCGLSRMMLRVRYPEV
ncbi:hypothetical protein BN1708_013478, partial [Verticillium longisporum]